jgi:hypothetical protein
MKKIAFIMILAAMFAELSNGSALAGPEGASSLKAGAIGFNVGVGDSVFGDTGVVTISGKYLILNDLAIMAGIGLQSSSGDLDANYYSMAAGVRKYFKTDDFAPFIEGRFTYVNEKYQLPGNSVDQTAFDFAAAFGAEYFLHRSFSIEGAVGLGFGTATIKNTGIPNQDYTYFGTRTMGLSANFYF